MPLKTALYVKSPAKRWSRGQKRRETLSVNMISRPLDDFRHLSHIGLEASGDAFGNLTAFQRTGSLFLQRSQCHQDLYPIISPSEHPPPKPLCLLNPEQMDGQAAKARSLPQVSRHKKYHSLPFLDAMDVEDHDGFHQGEEEKNQDGGLTMKTDGSELNSVPQKSPCPPDETHSVIDEDVSFTLNFNLGPSILEDVLQVMNQLHQ
ncbi:cdc42 effector protein 3-like [Esox lucius]|uniref:CRIB domain-containing protein n=1 Tax=Esox lucius TaxID=8010 RepID=A0AAY5KNC9_ESOLU|nr:cdc42 effector protein 3-like [Esox lucius]XP_010880623.1 cdc42 effector protein 3-like [Esox lucius]